MKQLLLSSFALALALHAPAGAAHGQTLRVGGKATTYLYHVQVGYLFGKLAEAQ